MADLLDSFLSSYHYDLDSNLIAQEPIEPRHNARLMVVERSKRDFISVKHQKVWDWQEELHPGDLIVLNDTRVLKARLRVVRSGGGKGELLLLEPKGDGNWLCLARPAKRMRPGDSLWLLGGSKEPMQLEVIAEDDECGGRIVKFPSRFAERETVEELLETCGEVPLPPYIHNQKLTNGDRYQTRYASQPGAVAAPTAGLHLSDELLSLLNKKGVKQTRVTLHVGLGTFRPLEREDLTNLQLHSEWVEVSDHVVRAVADCQSRGGRVIAVGTTSVRALEGAFAAGNGCLFPFKGKVDLVIKPGYRFGVVDGLLTNFHLPKSSLLLLVSALIGRKNLLALYENAIENQYRFFSYGDAMWISPGAINAFARLKQKQVVE